MQNSVNRFRMTLVYWSQPTSVVLCIQNSDFRTRITSLYGSQTSPMVFCPQNRVFGTRIASLYGSQPSSVVLRIQNSAFSIRKTCLYRSQHSFVAFSFITATLGPEIQVSMGPRPHLCFFAFKTATAHQNCKSLWVPALICGFMH